MSTTLEELLKEMRERGSSIDLNWGEDNDAWEASFISGGRRFVGVSVDTPWLALQIAYRKAERFGETGSEEEPTVPNPPQPPGYRPFA